MGSRHAAPRRPARFRRARTASAVVVAALLLSSWPTDAPAQGSPLAPLSPDRLTKTVDREVYGYLPYWEIDGTVDAYLRYDLLSTLSLFSITYNADGTINTSLAGYRAIAGETATLLIERAHAAGVRVEITVTSFGTAKNAAFFSDPVAQATAIAQTADLVTARGADGVNVDVELIEGTYFDEYGSFLAALGSVLFFGAAGPEEIRRTVPVVAGYTLLHFAVFLALGALFSWMVDKVESAPRRWLMMLLSFILLDGLFAGTVAMIGEWVIASIGVWAIIVGNVVAVLAMGATLWATHPELGHRLVQPTVQTTV